MVKAVLIDVGGPILNEDAEYAAWDRFLISLLREDGLNVSEEEFSRVVLFATQRCYSNPRVVALWHFVRPDLGRFHRLQDAFHDFQSVWTKEQRRKSLRPTVKDTIAALANQYILALAGNQPAYVANFLAQEGILSYFRWRWVSEEMGVSKPDLLFFRMILDGIGVSPEEAVMVGDRLDMDILPAKLIGLWTIRVLVGPYAEQIPISPLHAPHRTIRSTAELPGAIAQLVAAEDRAF